MAIGDTVIHESGGGGLLRWLDRHGSDPSGDLAAEEWILGRAGELAPALFTFSWDRPVLVVGFGRGTEGIDLDRCRREGVTVLRRCSGGAGVFHLRDLSASLVLPVGHPWARGLRDLYGRFRSAFRETLGPLGFPLEEPGDAGQPAGRRSPLCFEELGAETLLFRGRKALGCAQARKASGVLVHGTLLLSDTAAFQAPLFGMTAQRVEAALGPLPEGATGAAGLARALALEMASRLGSTLAPWALPDEGIAEIRSLAAKRRTP